MDKTPNKLGENGQELIENPKASMIATTAATVMLLISPQGASAQEPVAQDNPLFSVSLLGGAGTTFSDSPAVIGDKFSTTPGVIKSGTSQEYVARVTVPTGKNILGGELDAAIQGGYSASNGSANFAGIPSNFRTSQNSFSVLAGPMVRWDLGNGFEADAAALAGAEYTRNSLDFKDLGVARTINTDSVDFKWELVSGISKELADGFRVRIEGFVGNKSGFSVEENGGYLTQKDKTNGGVRVGFTKSFN